MDYSVLNKTTTKEDRELLMKFMDLPPQKILMYASAILSAYISTFSDEKNKEFVLKTVIDSITKEVYKKIMVVECAFCHKDFYTHAENLKDGHPLCPKCVFPDLGAEKEI